jgi:hypothetical protein
MGRIELDSKENSICGYGSPSNDFHGGERIRQNLFGNSYSLWMQPRKTHMALPGIHHGYGIMTSHVLQI